MHTPQQQLDSVVHRILGLAMIAVGVICTGAQLAKSSARLASQLERESACFLPQQILEMY